MKPILCLLLVAVVGSLSAATSFSAAGVSSDIYVADQHTLAVSISGTFVATIVLEQAVSGGYRPLETWTSGITYKPPRLTGVWRLRCSDYTSGTATYTLTSVPDLQVIYRKPNGTTAFSVDVDGVVTNSGGATSGGTIDNAVIGGVTPASGTFTTLFATSVSGPSIDNAIIGGTTPAAGSFTTLSASSTANLTGVATTRTTLKVGTQDQGASYLGIARNSASDKFAYINAGIGGDGVTQASTGIKLAVRSSGNTQVIGIAVDENGRATIGPIGSTFSGNVLAGVQDGTAALVGQVGEVFNSAVTSATNFTSTGTYQQLTSVALTPGDWDVHCTMTEYTSSATMTANADSILAISTTTASSAGTTEGQTIGYVSQNGITTATGKQTISLNFPLNLSAGATYFANGQATFTGGNPQYTVFLWARRIR